MTKSLKSFHILDPAHTDPARLKREREKARELRRTNWWRTLAAKGICHYCKKKFKAGELTMDHVTPLARGGTSTKGNIVPACEACNATKKLDTPVDDLFARLEAEREAKSAAEREAKSAAEREAKSAAERAPKSEEE